MSANLSENIIDIGIPLKNQLSLHERLKNTIQEEIWFDSRRTRHRMRLDENARAKYYPDTFNVFLLSPSGKYASFLKEFSRENKKADFYYKQLVRDNGISPIAFSDVIENYRSYDITDDRIRLLIAIHYLTLNHQNELTRISENKLDKMLEQKKKMNYYKIPETNLQFIPPLGFEVKNESGLTNHDLKASFFFITWGMEFTAQFAPNDSYSKLIKDYEIESEVESTVLRLIEVQYLPNQFQKSFMCLFKAGEKTLYIQGSMTDDKITWDELMIMLQESFSTMTIQDE